MSRNCLIKFLLVPLTLAFWVSSAYGQTLTAPTSLNLGSYVLSSDPTVPVTASFAVTASTTTATTYTATPQASTPWFNVTCASGSATTTVGDICTIVVSNSAVDALTGTATDTIVLQPVSGGNNVGTPSSVTVTLTLTASGNPSTLATASTIVLTYVSNGLANQSSAKQAGTITASDSSLETYSVVNALPGWLSATPTTGQIPSSGSDTVTFLVVQSGANSLPPGVTTTTVDLAISGEGVLPVVVTLNVIAAQPLSLASSSPLVDFGYVRAGTVPSNITATVQYVGPTASIAYSVNAATVPVWLSVTATSPATAAGVSVVFAAQSAVVPGLAAGNYTASVYLTAAGASSSLSIPVVLTVSNTAATMSIKEGTTTIPAIFTMSSSPVVPTPTVTVISSDEPISFTASCVVTTTNPTYVNTPTSCRLSGASTAAASVSGVAYTWGTALTTVFDPLLFATNTPYGALISLTVTVRSTSLTSPQTLSLRYTYSIQPAAPTFTAMSPTSANQIATGTSLIVTLTGSNFVGTGSIVGGAISPTRVFAGATDITANSVVINPTTLVVSVPQSAFPTSLSSTTHSANLTLGVANQTGTSSPAAATATLALVVTTAPVVYGVTSTATYDQPLPGAKPKIAPFELVSIFGANFTTGSPVVGAADAFGRFGSSVTLSGSGSSAVNLSVAFKSGSTTYAAPILFANANQINAIVPSGVPLGTATVTVTSGTLVSDGNFAVTIVPADPGIFTVSSEGVGQGAILNADGSVNQVGNETTAASWVSIYMTGLGVPNSTGLDAVSNTAVYPGYLQIANTKGSLDTPVITYTPPTTAWTNLDGVVINSTLLLNTQHLAPCFTTGVSGSTTVSVVFGTGSSAVTQTGTSQVLWAGFAGGSVAGLYQVNVLIPSGLAPSGPTTVPVQVILGTEGSSPAGVVTMAVK
jgi:uncharacterized protein (TIGR03437 family)